MPHILLVDDSEDVLLVISKLLERAGHEVRTASNGDQALQTADEFRPEVVCLDLLLADTDGYQIATQMRSRPWSGACRIYTVSGSELDESRAATCGINGHLIKPVRFQEIDRLITGDTDAGQKA